MFDVWCLATSLFYEWKHEIFNNVFVKFSPKRQFYSWIFLQKRQTLKKEPVVVPMTSFGSLGQWNDPATTSQRSYCCSYGFLCDSIGRCTFLEMDEVRMDWSSAWTGEGWTTTSVRPDEPDENLERRAILLFHINQRSEEKILTNLIKPIRSNWKHNTPISWINNIRLDLRRFIGQEKKSKSS